MSIKPVREPEWDCGYRGGFRFFVRKTRKGYEIRKKSLVSKEETLIGVMDDLKAARERAWVAE